MITSTKLAYTLLIGATIYWAFATLQPSNSDAERIEQQTGFSINNALDLLKNIAKETHYPGTQEHKNVQNYIVKELQKLGLQPEIQTQTVFNKKWLIGTTTENIIARIKGSKNGKALLLLTHYDSNPHSAIGASDAGAGVVTILEGIRAFLTKNKSHKNDIIILISDAEELGLLGAKAFVDAHPWKNDVELILNFEARGSGGPSYMLMETNGKNSKLVTEFLKAKPNFPAANSLMYSIYKMLPNDTDLTVFREEADINGFNFAFIGDHFDYHSAQDNFERLDKESLIHQADYLMTTLPYFANSDLSNLNSDKDLIYVNFPFLRLLTFPFSWILPMLIIAFLVFIFLVYFGISNGKLTIKGIYKGSIPFLISLVIIPTIVFFLWKLLLFAHPKYNDMLHGFTYNGYHYIWAFSLLSLWLNFKIYNKFFNDISASNLLVTPLFTWLIINGLIYTYLQGAGFFIIPVFSSLLVFSILIFMNLKNHRKPVLCALLYIPTLYIFTPLIKMFPVGLGLKMLFISSIFIVLLFGLLLPVFHQQKKKNNLQFYVGFLAFIFFGIATFKSGFSVDKKFPNSLIYVQNEETKIAYFSTYNTTLDQYIQQKLGNNPTQGNIVNANTQSKYGTPFTYHKKTENKHISTADITIKLDSIFLGKRHIEITIKPTRKLTKLEILSSNKTTVDSLFINNILINNGKEYTPKRTNFLTYYFANQDKKLDLKFSLAKDKNLQLIINEISNDLLKNPNFNISPRTKSMLPMPFVTNDAIITSKKLKL